MRRSRRRPIVQNGQRAGDPMSCAIAPRPPADSRIMLTALAYQVATERRPRDAFRSAKWYLTDRLPRHDRWRRYNMEVWNLIGDPMLKLRLPEP